MARIVWQRNCIAVVFESMLFARVWFMRLLFIFDAFFILVAESAGCFQGS
jgi:hypothetical protein